MNTFNNYLAEKGLQSKLIETATLMVEKNVEPFEFLQKWYEENYPEVACILDEGLWDNVKQAGGQMWQGVKQGAQQFAANQWGPMSKFQTATQALTDLENYMKNDPELARRGGGLIQQVNKMNQILRKMQNYIPQMQTPKTANKWSQPNAPAQQAAQAQPAAQAQQAAPGYHTTYAGAGM